MYINHSSVEAAIERFQAPENNGDIVSDTGQIGTSVEIRLRCPTNTVPQTLDKGRRVRKMKIRLKVKTLYI